ncbi:MAG: ZIP family metal transporter [Ignavibacteriaceae bacterium]
MQLTILTKSIFAVISALAGASFLFTIKLKHKKLCGLISFSAGALLGAAAFALIPESSINLGWLEVALSVLSGYLLFFFISKYYSHVCPACSASHFDEQTTKRFTEIVLTLLTALSIHSFLDGLAIATSGVPSQGGDQSVFVAILAHKFPEGLALAALMLSSNYSRLKIFLYVAAVELVTIIGSVAGLFFFKSGISGLLMGAVMAHIAGGFIYLAIHAVFGEMYKNHKILVVSSFAAGIVLIFIVHLIFI